MRSTVSVLPLLGPREDHHRELGFPVPLLTLGATGQGECICNMMLAANAVPSYMHSNVMLDDELSRSPVEVRGSHGGPICP